MKIKVYTASEVAQILNTSVNTVYLEARQGKIKSFKVGSSWRFNEEDVLTYMEGKENQETPKPVAAPAPILKSQRLLICSRHPGIVAWLKTQGIFGDEISGDVRYSDVVNRVVIGELPISLVFPCKAFYRVEIPGFRPADYQRNLTIADMLRLGARICRIKATREVVELQDAKEQIKELLKTP